MPADDDVASGLIWASGLQLTEDETADLATLYARFAPDRERLADMVLGDTEPMIIFTVRHEAEHCGAR